MRISLRIISGATLLALGLAGVPASAQEVFKSENEDGVVSFSDVHTEGAVRLELPSVTARSESIEAQQRMIEQQLAVAKSLEESRLARSEARTRRLEALAAAAPKTVYYRDPEPRYVGSSGRYWGRWPGHGYRPGYPGHGPGYPSHPGKPPGGHRPDQGGGSISRPLPPLKPR